MDEITKATITNALQLRHCESYPEYHARRAIEMAKASGSEKARIEIEALEKLLPKAHRVQT